MTRPKNETCTFCHKLDLQDNPVIHKPVASGDCLPCHDPHGGATGKFLRGSSMSQLCNQCHKDMTDGKKFVHGPVAAGACEACHQPHASQNPKLLVAQGKDLCFGCHKEMADQMKAARVTHKPVMEGECSQCHDPHASDYVKQTRLPPVQLCTSCHEHDTIKKLATESKYKHSVVTNDAACLNCHTSHGGSVAKLLKNEPVKLCMNCHKKQIVVDKTRVIPAMAEVDDPTQMKHGPLQHGDCSGCHNVHGGEISRLLAKAYPDAFYQPFELQKYALCFTCHDQQLVLQEKTSGLTGFRDGERNLHYVHVNIADRGRSCRACHETHASKLPLHIRESVPYGKWNLPLNFQKTATGGSCSPGCHRTYAYDRVTPMASASAPAAPAAVPSLAPTPATQESKKEGQP
jgi:predicted CXXCH cytochrome family protein